MGAPRVVCRKRGTCTVRYCRPGRYEVRASQKDGEEGAIIAIRETRFRAHQVADAWVADQQKKGQGS